MPLLKNSAGDALTAQDRADIQAGSLLGAYASLAALAAAFPAATGLTGVRAIVGTGAPYALYRCDGNAWTKEPSLGADSLTTSDLIALAQASGLVPGACYLTTDGLSGRAVTNRLFQPDGGMWYHTAVSADVGASTSAVDLAYTYLPPLGANSRVVQELQGEVTEGGTNAKRLRMVLAGTLGGGTAGSSAIWTRNLNVNTDQGIFVRGTLSCRNDTSALLGMTGGDTASYGITSSDWTTISGVNMGVSQLLRVMGETSLASGGTPGTPFEGAKTVTLSRAATDVAQAVYTGHGLTTGRWVAIAGAGDTAYNKTSVQVTVIDANTFQYAAPGITATPGGAPTWQQYNVVALQSWAVMIFQRP